MVTVLAVRHADVDLPPDGPDPDLNAAGRQRAEALARLIGSADVTAILTSHFRRTQQTVEPLVQRLGVTPQVAPVAAELAQRLRAAEFGDVVVVAGHSNTVPDLLDALGVDPVPDIAETEFDDLFVVTVLPAAGAGLLRLSYGEHT